MAYDLHDTIAAIATAPGGAIRGVVRLSGPKAVRCASQCFTSAHRENLAEVRRATTLAGHVQVMLAGRWYNVPCDLLLWPNTHSYTRQPLAEFHLPGAPAVLDALLERLFTDGARLAEPGEFTLRAFLAGRIDLTQAEAVLGIIDAPSGPDYQTALAQLAGGLAAPLGALRDDLLQLLAELEAGLDFVEEDIQFISRDEVAARLAASHQAVRAVEEQLSGRRDSINEHHVVLLGRPNVGKSSLFNALTARYGLEDRPHAAIVSPARGTTRDYLLTELDLGGVRCRLVDTAGLIDEAVGDGAIHAASQTHSQEQGRLSTLQLICTDEWPLEAPVDMAAGPAILVVTKADLGVATDEPSGGFSRAISSPNAIATSSHTGQGLDELAIAIRSALVGADDATSGGAVATTAIRCHESLRLASESLASAHKLAAGDFGDELIAAEVRTTLMELGKVVGAVTTDDILDRVFGSFCIGK